MNEVVQSQLEPLFLNFDLIGAVSDSNRVLNEAQDLILTTPPDFLHFGRRSAIVGVNEESKNQRLLSILEGRENSAITHARY